MSDVHIWRQNIIFAFWLNGVWLISVIRLSAHLHKLNNKIASTPTQHIRQRENPFQRRHQLAQREIINQGWVIFFGSRFKQIVFFFSQMLCSNYDNCTICSVLNNYQCLREVSSGSVACSFVLDGIIHNFAEMARRKFSAVEFLTIYT